MSKPPSSLPPTPNGGPLQVSLILGSFKYTSASYKLFELYLPKTLPAPAHPEEHLYKYRPPIHHTFREAPRLPPKVISLVFAGAVLAPWVVLLGLVSSLRSCLVNVSNSQTSAVSHPTLPQQPLLTQNLAFRRASRRIRRSPRHVLGRAPPSRRAAVRCYPCDPDCCDRQARTQRNGAVASGRKALGSLVSIPAEGGIQLIRLDKTEPAPHILLAMCAVTHVPLSYLESKR